MKSPLLIVLMLAFSIGYAQSTELDQVIESSKTISVSNDDTIISFSVDNKTNTIKENDSILIDYSKLKTTISRSSSDIRIYLNRKRKAGNISFVFPQINKAVKA
jgi:hypothetical protein